MRENKQGGLSAFYDLVPEVTRCHPYIIPPVGRGSQSPAHTKGEGNRAHLSKGGGLQFMWSCLNTMLSYYHVQRHEVRILPVCLEKNGVSIVGRVDSCGNTQVGSQWDLALEEVQGLKTAVPGCTEGCSGG